MKCPRDSRVLEVTRKGKSRGEMAAKANRCFARFALERSRRGCEETTLRIENPLTVRGGEEDTVKVSEDAAVQVLPIARGSSVGASELSALNDRESDREA
ncbi:hypothetical protein Bca52824_053968 [Brassica carinata]|uniref:Uncharacterized protein n=1 Tax=Brassica carinata TaxID=52824 RepID=A0A8X7R7L3_BRACI|nr:hypothetical protein Bca52824_053968 [Brassica carinata]